MLYEQCLENRVKQVGMMWWTEYTTWIRRAVGRQCHLFVGWIKQDLSFLGTCFLSCKMDMMVCPRELVRIKWVQRFFKKRYSGSQLAWAFCTRDSEISKLEVDEKESHQRRLSDVAILRGVLLAMGGETAVRWLELLMYVWRPGWSIKVVSTYSVLVMCWHWVSILCCSQFNFHNF